MYESWGNAAQKSCYDENWIVYLLESDDLEYYVGMTHNIKRRVQEHRRGATPKTSKFKNVRLIARTTMELDYIKASKLERQLYLMKNPLYFFTTGLNDLVYISNNLEDTKLESQVRWILSQSK